MSQNSDLKLLQDAMKKRHAKPKHLHRERIRVVDGDAREAQAARYHFAALRAAALRKTRRIALEYPANSQLFTLMGISKRDEQLDILRLRDTFGPIAAQALADAGFISDKDEAMRLIGVPLA
jgi:hypothetical protein